MATITMTDIEYNQMLTQKMDYEKQIADLNKQLITAQSEDSEGRVSKLVRAMSAARDVIGFAVAHLPPEAVKGWPFEKLREFAKIMETAPVPYDWKENAIDLLSFARECETLEKERAMRPVHTRTEQLERELAGLRAQLTESSTTKAE